jgi:flagellar motility protein MotE (MotC chaperone)
MAKVPRLLPLIAIAIGGVVAVRAVGAGPGLFEGAKAWAEEAAGAVAPAPGNTDVPKAPAPVCALTPEQLAQQAGISPAELRIIQSLSTRRKELDARDADFSTTLPLMVAAEQKLDAKVQALTAIKAEIQGMLGQVDAKSKAETDRLVAVYSAMRPREAAAVFNTLSDDVRLPVAAAMRPRGLAAVLAQMPPAKAQELTEKLARRFEAQQLAARAAAASAAEPVAQPAEQPAAAPAPAPAANAAAKPATQTPAATPARQAPRAAANRPRTPARIPARTPARQPAATPAASGPQPYAAGASAPAANGPAAPRQSVQ